jgi:hypothetical protein
VIAEADRLQADCDKSCIKDYTMRLCEIADPRDYGLSDTDLKDSFKQTERIPVDGTVDDAEHSPKSKPSGKKLRIWFRQ